MNSKQDLEMQPLTKMKKSKKNQLKGEREKGSVETQITPRVKASSIPINQQAYYAKKNLQGNNEVMQFSSRKPVLEGLSNPHPGEDTLEHIMDKAVELNTLYKSKNSLKKVESWMTEKGKQNSLSSPKVFNHILESLVTEEK